MFSGSASESHGVFTPTLLACCGITGAIHAASYLLNATLPLHVVALGGSKAQVGMLFSVTTVVSMVLRPLVGGWIDRYGFRPVMLPGALALLATSLAFQVAATPGAVIALMTGLGLSNGLISTSAGVLAAQASPPDRRGEALSVYYVATSVAIGVGAPLGLALYRAAGMSANFVVATGLAVGIGLLVWLLALRPAPLGEPSAFRWYSRRALPAGCVMILATVGHSSIFAFVPLHVISGGMAGHLWWFYTLFSAWIIACRLLLRRASDRVGRVRVLVPALGSIALGFFALAAPPGAMSLALGALLLGSGAALLYPTFVALLVDRTPESERGSAIGTLAGSFDLGVVVGSLLVGFTVERASFGAGFGLAGLSAVLGLVVFLLTERARARVLPRSVAEV